MYTLYGVVKITCEQSIAPHTRHVTGVTESSSTWKRGHTKSDDFAKTSLQKRNKKLSKHFVQMIIIYQNLALLLCEKVKLVKSYLRLH